jgi:hypothetical protein
LFPVSDQFLVGNSQERAAHKMLPPPPPVAEADEPSEDISNEAKSPPVLSEQEILSNQIGIKLQIGIRFMVCFLAKLLLY